MKKSIILIACLAISILVFTTDLMSKCRGVTDHGNVPGNKKEWTHIATVPKGSILRVHANGTVNFGCRFCRCVDGAGAGVTGKSLVFVKIFQTLKNELEAVVTPNPADKMKKHMDVYRKNFGRTHEPNYNQGGVWIKVVKKHGGAHYIPTQLYYFWIANNGINRMGLPINEDVDVFARAHDGGKNSESTGGYGDNSGAYMVSVSTK
jgi:hypothetical protein